jgi:FMN reductase
MITVINGNPRADSRTGKLANATGLALAGRLSQSAPHVVDLSPLGYRLLVAGDVTRRLAIAAIVGADTLIVATPTYKGSYTGILKVLLDSLPHNGLSGKIAVPLVTAANAQQAASASDKLIDLLSELGATVVTPGLIATEPQLATEDVAASLADEFADRLAAHGAFGLTAAAA